MNELAQFHFLRPQWLWLLPLLGLLLWRLRRPLASLGPWRRICDAHLLRYLAIRPGSGGGYRWALALLGLAWVIATLALAGPAWQQRPQALFRALDARVIVLDLSRSMLADDLVPNRLERARIKIADILRRSQEGRIALVAYAGESFVVAPLTRDANTVNNMLGALSPQIMPVQGSELSEALVLSEQLLTRANATAGEILVLTDSARAADIEVARHLSQRGYRVSVLAVGTLAGAPIPHRNGGYFKAEDGSIVVPRLLEAPLRQLAAAGTGRYARIAADRSDLDHLLNADGSRVASEALDEQRQRWREEGPWLVLLLLPLAALAFRRGWLLALVAVVMLPVQPLRAEMWADLWRTRDQQASRALERGEAERAARLAELPLLRGQALYEAGNYRAAARIFALVDSADAHYNRGNALARMGQFEAAIAAYDSALLRQAEMEDAQHNKALLERLLQQQEAESEPDADQNEDANQGDQQEQGQNAQDNQQNSAEAADPNESEEQRQVSPEDPMSNEQRQAVEQWLRRIPDDPGGLLRSKFLLEYRRRGQPAPQYDESW